MPGLHGFFSMKIKGECMHALISWVAKGGLACHWHRQAADQVGVMSGSAARVLHGREFCTGLCIQQLGTQQSGTQVR
jgi:hypothetical protein